MLCGKQPFFGNSESDLIDKLLNFEFVTFRQEVWNNINHEVKELIAKLICKDPEKRLTAFDAKQHVWFKKMNGEDETVFHQFKPIPDYVKEFKDYIHTQKDFKNELFRLMTKHLTATEAYNIKDFLNVKNKKVFNNESLSANLIHCKELFKIILQFAQSSHLREELEKILEDHKECMGNMIDYNNLFEDFEKNKELIKKIEMWNLFNNIDKENKGVISKTDVNKLVNSNSKHFTNDNVKEVVNFDNFVDILNKTNPDIHEK